VSVPFASVGEAVAKVRWVVRQLWSENQALQTTLGQLVDALEVSGGLAVHAQLTRLRGRHRCRVGGMRKQHWQRDWTMCTNFCK
jgi:hypothetical protein